MFGVINIIDEREMLPALATTAAPDKYFQEVMRWLPTDALEAVIAEASAYEDEGMITQRVEDIVRRANILREADRIITKFSPNSESASNFA